MGMLDEAGPGVYVPNSMTRLLAQPDYAAGIIFLFVLPHSPLCVCVCVCIRFVWRSDTADRLSYSQCGNRRKDFAALCDVI